MRKGILLSVCAFAALSSVASAQQITNYSVLQDWLPITLIAVMLSISIVGIYYILGYLLNNRRVKAAAVSELGQAVGTGIIVLFIIAVFTMVGTSQLSFVSFLSPKTLSGTLCAQLGSSSLGILNAKDSSTYAGAICNAVGKLAASGGAASSDITPQIDYGLFYSYLIAANMTNQAVNNLQAFYVYTGWIGFLSSFKQFTGYCVSDDPLIPLCSIPIIGEASTIVEVDYKSVPYAGYFSILDMSRPTQLESVLAFYMMLLQMQMIQFFLVVWPYLLAAGIILRSTFFTRGIGGLLMGLSITAVLVFPIMYGMEYSAFSNGYIGSGTSGSIGPIGANNLPTMPLYELNNGARTVYGVNTAVSYNGYIDASLVPGVNCGGDQVVYENVCGYPGTVDENPKCIASSSSPGPTCCSKTATTGCVQSPGINVNFFVSPDASKVLSYYHCMPSGGLLNAEASFAVFYMIPFVGQLTGIQGLVTGVPATPLDWPLDGCTPSRAIGAALAMINLYGITFASGVLFPLINILIALASMSGLATLFGGDTDIIGLSKII